jgi:dTDP-4-dehydrorhamnose reductase
LKKILLTGASGFLGYKLLPQLSSNYRTEGIFNRQYYDIELIKWHQLNLMDEKALKKTLETIQPDAIIHAAAQSNPNFCEENPALAYHLNVYSTVSIGEYCKKKDIPLIFISTDLVFNGSQGFYTESDFCYPLSKYGEQKQIAEDILLEDLERIIICRLPLLFGQGPLYSNNFFRNWIKKFDNAEEIAAFSDEFRSPISSEWAAKGIELALDYLLDNSITNKERIFHLGGPERISRYDFALLIAEVFGYDPSNVKALLRNEMPMSAPRPEDVSLDSSLAAETLGFRPESLEKQLLSLKNSVKHV